MGNISDKIANAMQTETVFTIPLFGGIDVDEGVVVTWIIMAVMIILAIVLTRNFSVSNISKRQATMELIVTKLEGLFANILGEDAKKYTPYLITVLLYISISDVFGIFGFKPPTKDFNVTIALALMSIVLVQIAGIRKRKIGGWLKSFAQPMVLVAPFNILDLVTRPLSLCMRLFGNILGSFIIMTLLEVVAPVVVPAIFSIYFDFFDGLLQAYVFVFLTSIYLKEAVEIAQPE